MNRRRRRREQLASTALGLIPLAQADVHTAPAAPAATYVGVENWLWVPTGQWRTLTKSVNAGATTVTVTAAPSQIVWNLGPSSITCYDPGKPWVQGMTDVATTTCGYTYETTSDRPARRAFLDLGDDSLPGDVDLHRSMPDNRR